MRPARSKTRVLTHAIVWLVLTLVTECIMCFVLPQRDPFVGLTVISMETLLVFGPLLIILEWFFIKCPKCGSREDFWRLNNSVDEPGGHRGENCRHADRNTPVVNYKNWDLTCRCGHIKKRWCDQTLVKSEESLQRARH